MYLGTDRCIPRRENGPNGRAFSLPKIDGGIQKVVYCGSHTIAYFTFGEINDPQIAIINDTRIP